jgi:hypothetical protein
MKTLALFSLVVMGCAGGGDNSVKPIDLSPGPDDGGVGGGGGGGGGGSDGGGSMSQACTSYPASTIAAARQGGKSGCFELDNVVTLAVTPVSTNTKSVTLYVQDAAGGDYSAIKLTCSSTSTSHMCTAFATAKNILAGRSVTVQGTYIKSSAAKGGYEDFLIDNIADNAAGTAPAPATVMETDLARSASVPARWFQVVSVNVTDKLGMFDWSPPELKRSGTSTACPQWYGFGMIPKSANATAGAACTGSTQPAGQTTVNPKEVLIGTDFYTGFKTTGDCACGAMYMDPVPTATQGTLGTVSALLVYDVPSGQSTGYQYLEPLTDAAFPIK